MARPGDETPDTFRHLLRGGRYRLGCGAAIVDEVRGLLLVHRRREPEAGHWGLPGGKVDPGERAVDAAVREVDEELGIGITPLRLLLVAAFEHVATAERWIAPVYLARLVRGEPRLCEPEAHTALAWFTPESLPGPLTSATQQALPALARARERAGRT